MKTQFKISWFILLLIITSCNPKSKISGYYNYKTSCVSVEGDGSQTVKAWGSGNNRADAIEQAYKNAVRDVLFKGIIDGRPECNKRPVLAEVNARKKYERYFNNFFSDNGPYKDFVSEKDGSRYHIEVIKERKKAGSQEMYGVVVRVLRPALKEKMIKDGILKIN